MRNLKAVTDSELLSILRDVKQELRQIFGHRLKQLILYGSYARKEQDPESDIDIMILVEASEEQLRKYRYVIADVMGELTIKYGILVSLTEATYHRYVQYLDILPFYKNIHDEGIEIYGKESA